MKSYKPRVADAILAKKMEYIGAVVVEGPKWCGKTTTCKQLAKSVLDLSDPDELERVARLSEINIGRFLDGISPRLIDEWQLIPRFWDAVRSRVDKSDGCGLFMLTGSAVVPEEKRSQIKHSGTGRMSRLKMRPMSLFESGESSGSLSIHRLFDGEPFDVLDGKNLSLDEIAYILCRGGWPKAVERGGEIALEYAKDYVASIAESDISRVDDKPRDPGRVRRLLKSLARLQATQAALPAIRKDIVANDDASLSEQTIADYISALEKIFVVENTHSWSPELRAKTAIRTSATRYFTDPSIATAALGISPGDLLDDIRTFGLFFETLAVRDIRVYAEAFGGFVEHYRDKTGLECDAVIHWPNGDFGLVEIKLGGETLVEEGVHTIRKLQSLLEAKSHRPPKFSMVATAVGDCAYMRTDGIIVAPISSLAP